MYTPTAPSVECALQGVTQEKLSDQKANNYYLYQFDPKKR